MFAVKPFFDPVPPMTVLQVYKQPDPPRFAAGERDAHCGDFIGETSQVVALNPMNEIDQVATLKRGSRRRDTRRKELIVDDCEFFDDSANFYESERIKIDGRDFRDSDLWSKEELNFFAQISTRPPYNPPVGAKPEFSAVIYDFETGEVQTAYVSATIVLEIRP